MTCLTLLRNSCGRHFCQWAIQQQTNRGRTHYSSRHSLLGWAVAVSDGAPLDGTLGHVHLIGMLLVPSHVHSQLPHTPSPRTHPTACVTEPVRKLFVWLHYLTKTVTSFTQCTCLTDFFKIPVPANLTDLIFGYCWYTCRNLLITRLGRQPNCGSVRRSVRGLFARPLTGRSLVHLPTSLHSLTLLRHPIPPPSPVHSLTRPHFRRTFVCTAWHFLHKPVSHLSCLAWIHLHRVPSKKWVVAFGDGDLWDAGLWWFWMSITRKFLISFLFGQNYSYHYQTLFQTLFIHFCNVISVISNLPLSNPTNLYATFIQPTLSPSKLPLCQLVSIKFTTSRLTSIKFRFINLFLSK